jgi:hypothetical protein
MALTCILVSEVVKVWLLQGQSDPQAYNSRQILTYLVDVSIHCSLVVGVNMATSS